LDSKIGCPCRLADAPEELHRLSASLIDVSERIKDEGMIKEQQTLAVKMK